MIHKNTYNKVDFNGVKGLVFIGNKILVYRRDSNTNRSPLLIDLPGGGKEENESPFDTFKREVKEEFGIHIKENDIVHSFSHQSSMEPSKESYFFITNKLCIKEEDIIFGNEGVEWMTMTLDEFLNIKDAIRRQQEQVQEYLKKI